MTKWGNCQVSAWNIFLQTCYKIISTQWAPLSIKQKFQPLLIYSKLFFLWLLGLPLFLWFHQSNLIPATSGEEMSNIKWYVISLSFTHLLGNNGKKFTICHIEVAHNFCYWYYIVTAYLSITLSLEVVESGSFQVLGKLFKEKNAK